MTAPRPVLEAVNRLERFNQERERIVGTVKERILTSRLRAAEKGGEHALEYVLNDVAFSEIHRLEAAKSRKQREALQQWRELAHRLGRMTPAEARQELEALIDRFAWDIVGNFDPRVYRFADEVLPTILSLLFSPLSSIREGIRAVSGLGGRIQVEGPLDVLRSACERGTMVVVPTHSSNMDSIVLGFGLSRSNLPPVTYGAGVNLFSNPFVSFFMHNLGAYRVDRRLRFELYKDVLKEYSTVLLEYGYHSLFFPGGTRCRSNQVERQLKLGLLGTAVTAYFNNVRRGEPYRRIYVVPMTINYRLVLEAETLISDYLAETGKSRYIIEDDEFSRVGRMAEFMRKILAHEGAVVLRFGMPRDPFGNLTDEAGESLDRRGRPVDPASFLRGADGEYRSDPQRDAEYTRTLGAALVTDYRRLTVFLSTHLLARALFDAVTVRARTRDIYRLLRLAGSTEAVPIGEIEQRIEVLRRRIAASPAWGSVHTAVATCPVADLVADALRALGTYHTRPVAQRIGNQVVASDMELLYYYQNRTDHVPVEESP